MTLKRIGIIHEGNDHNFVLIMVSGRLKNIWENWGSIRYPAWFMAKPLSSMRLIQGEGRDIAKSAVSHPNNALFPDP